MRDKERGKAEVEDLKTIAELFHEEEKPNKPQSQSHQPGSEMQMQPQPIAIYPDYKPADKLKDKVVLVTGGDSGIGKAVVYHCLYEGAKVFFSYYDEQEDAQAVCDYATSKGFSIAPPMRGDLSKRAQCQKLVREALDFYGTIDVLINNIAIQYYNEDFSTISDEQLERVFATNLFSFFYMVQACLPYLTEGDSIINTASITAFRGSGHLVDYAATKGAIVSFTRSLANQLLQRKIRVNAVAPGPVWTPLIPASFPADRVGKFGKDTMEGKPGEPADIAPCYVFLASQDSAFMTGQVLHPNGGQLTFS